MKHTLIRPRLSSLEIFASALLVTMGVEFQAGCGSEVTVDTGNTGGAGGSGTTSSSVSSSGNTTTTSSSSSSSGFIPGTNDCIDPMPIIINGVDTGVDQCAGGQLLRREAVDCPTNLPDTNPCCGTCPDGQVCDTSGEIACTCVPACTQDSDCAAGQLCLCGDVAGLCKSAKCQTAADCAPGEQCTSWDTTLGCMYIEFACTTPADTCSGDLDCSSQMPFSFCAVQPDGHRECVAGGCAIGRPFLVDGEARMAALASRHDWRERDVLPNLEGIDETLADALASAWEHTARMEHASIAAFARFSLELLSLGAPSDLVMRTNAAMVDETRHARVAFAMASAYRKRPIGPGRLSMQGAMQDGDDIASFIERVIREGCVGETVAAVEAGEASVNAVDVTVRQTLEMIAKDESEHAELAWRTVKWALCAFGTDVRATIETEMVRLEQELGSVHEDQRSLWDRQLLEHGVVTNEVRTSIRRQTIRQVVLPCLSAMLRSVSRDATRTESIATS